MRSAIKDKKLLTISIIFFLIYSIQSITSYISYYVRTYDLAIYTQNIYLISKNLPLFNTIIYNHILANHFEPILYPLAAFLAFIPKPVPLLLFQALIVTISIYPLFPVIYDKLKNKTHTYILLGCYLSSLGILYAINFDFHTSTLAVLPLSCMLYAWYFNKHKLFLISCFLALTFKEDLPIFILGFGLLFLLQKKWKMAGLTITISFISAYLITSIIIPSYTPKEKNFYTVTEQYKTSKIPVTNPIQAIVYIVTHPLYLPSEIFNNQVKLNTLLVLFSDYGFLSLLSIIPYLLALPHLFLRFTSSYSNFWQIMWHYNAPLEPFLCVGAAYGVSLLTNILKINKKTLTIIFTVLALSIVGKIAAFPIKTTVQNIVKMNKTQHVKEALKKIPPTAAVSAQWNIAPHLAERQKIYIYKNIFDTEYIILDPALAMTNKQLQDADYSQNLALRDNLQLLPSFENIQEEQTKLRNSKEWKIIYQIKTLTIFKKTE
jgi:uncharacterized membrane protein